MGFGFKASGRVWVLGFQGEGCEVYGFTGFRGAREVYWGGVQGSKGLRKFRA